MFNLNTLHKLCYFAENTSHTWSDVLVLAIFFILCACLSLAVLAIICWLRPCNSCHCITSCLRSTRRNQLPASRKRRKHNMKTLTSFSSERPLSCGSFYSSSHGSGSQETEESSDTVPVKRSRDRAPKSVSPLACCSVYSDPVAHAPYFATMHPMTSRDARNNDGFASLGVNFRSSRNKRELGRVRRWMMENSITDEEMQQQAPAAIDDVIATHALLQLPCGESQPHYTATKFHSFRAKKSRRLPTAMDLHGTSTPQSWPVHPSAQDMLLHDSYALEADTSC